MKSLSTWLSEQGTLTAYATRYDLMTYWKAANPDSQREPFLGLSKASVELKEKVLADSESYCRLDHNELDNPKLIVDVLKSTDVGPREFIELLVGNTIDEMDLQILDAFKLGENDVINTLEDVLRRL